MKKKKGKKKKTEKMSLTRDMISEIVGHFYYAGDYKTLCSVSLVSKTFNEIVKKDKRYNYSKVMQEIKVKSNSKWLDSCVLNGKLVHNMKNELWIVNYETLTKGKIIFDRYQLIQSGYEGYLDNLKIREVQKGLKYRGIDVISDEAYLADAQFSDAFIFCSRCHIWRNDEDYEPENDTACDHPFSRKDRGFAKKIKKRVEYYQVSGSYEDESKPRDIFWKGYMHIKNELVKFEIVEHFMNGLPPVSRK